MKIEIQKKGLKHVIKHYDQHKRVSSNAHWQLVNKNGMLWQLTYDKIPVIDCIEGRHHNNCLTSEQYQMVHKTLKKYGL